INDRGGQIQFLYQLAEGPAQKSYGIQVAKLAGLPTSVVKNASRILKGLERNQGGASSQMDLWDSLGAEEISEKDEAMENLVDSLKQLEVQKLTPLDALNKLAKWQQELS
ncbi:MAG: DNA mismatch repair protein MutS, partial [Pseudomonadota bacterium]